jgi:hypothetical protein
VASLPSCLPYSYTCFTRSSDNNIPSLCMCLSASGGDTDHLYISILSATNELSLKAPYIHVAYLDQTFKTKAAAAPTHPVWNEVFAFQVRRPSNVQNSGGHHASGPQLETSSCDITFKLCEKTYVTTVGEAASATYRLQRNTLGEVCCEITDARTGKSCGLLNFVVRWGHKATAGASSVAEMEKLIAKLTVHSKSACKCFVVSLIALSTVSARRVAMAKAWLVWLHISSAEKVKRGLKMAMTKQSHQRLTNAKKSHQRQMAQMKSAARVWLCIVNRTAGDNLAQKKIYFNRWAELLPAEDHLFRGALQPIVGGVSCGASANGGAYDSSSDEGVVMSGSDSDSDSGLDADATQQGDGTRNFVRRTSKKALANLEGVIQRASRKDQYELADNVLTQLKAKQESNVGNMAARVLTPTKDALVDPERTTASPEASKKVEVPLKTLQSLGVRLLLSRSAHTNLGRRGVGSCFSHWHRLVVCENVNDMEQQLVMCKMEMANFKADAEITAFQKRADAAATAAAAGTGLDGATTAAGSQHAHTSESESSLKSWGASLWGTTTTATTTTAAAARPAMDTAIAAPIAIAATACGAEKHSSSHRQLQAEEHRLHLAAVQRQWESAFLCKTLTRWSHRAVRLAFVAWRGELTTAHVSQATLLTTMAQLEAMQLKNIQQQESAAAEKLRQLKERSVRIVLKERRMRLLILLRAAIHKGEHVSAALAFEVWKRNCRHHGRQEGTQEAVATLNAMHEAATQDAVLAFEKDRANLRLFGALQTCTAKQRVTSILRAFCTWKEGISSLQITLALEDATAAMKRGLMELRVKERFVGILQARASKRRTTETLRAFCRWRKYVVEQYVEEKEARLADLKQEGSTFASRFRSSSMRERFRLLLHAQTSKGTAAQLSRGFYRWQGFVAASRTEIEVLATQTSRHMKGRLLEVLHTQDRTSRHVAVARAFGKWGRSVVVCRGEDSTEQLRGTQKKQIEVVAVQASRRVKSRLLEVLHTCDRTSRHVAVARAFGKWGRSVVVCHGEDSMERLRETQKKQIEVVAVQASRRVKSRLLEVLHTCDRTSRHVAVARAFGKWARNVVVCRGEDSVERLQETQKGQIEVIAMQASRRAKGHLLEVLHNHDRISQQVAVSRAFEKWGRNVALQKSEALFLANQDICDKAYADKFKQLKERSVKVVLRERRMRLLLLVQAFLKRGTHAGIVVAFEVWKRYLMLCVQRVAKREVQLDSIHAVATQDLSTVEIAAAVEKTRLVVKERFCRLLHAHGTKMGSIRVLRAFCTWRRGLLSRDAEDTVARLTTESAHARQQLMGLGILKSQMAAKDEYAMAAAESNANFRLRLFVSQILQFCCAVQGMPIDTEMGRRQRLRASLEHWKMNTIILRTQEQNERRAVFRVFATVFNSRMASAWRVWVSFVAAAALQETTVKKVVAKLKYVHFARAFETWRGFVVSLRTQEERFGTKSHRIQNIMFRMRSRVQRTVVSSWQLFVGRQKRAEELMCRIVGRICHGALGGCWNRWVRTTLLMRHHTISLQTQVDKASFKSRQLWNLVSRKHSRLQRAVVSSWQLFVESQKCAETRMRRVVDRMRHATICSCWNRWVRTVLAMRHQDATVAQQVALLRTSLARIQNGLVMFAWNTWKKRVDAERRQEHLLKRTLHKATWSYYHQVLQSFATWKRTAVASSFVCTALAPRVRSANVALAFSTLVSFHARFCPNNRSRSRLYFGAWRNTVRLRIILEKSAMEIARSKEMNQTIKSLNQTYEKRVKSSEDTAERTQRRLEDGLVYAEQCRQLLSLQTLLRSLTTNHATAMQVAWDVWSGHSRVRQVLRKWTCRSAVDIRYRRLETGWARWMSCDMNTRAGRAVLRRVMVAYIARCHHTRARCVSGYWNTWKHVVRFEQLAETSVAQSRAHTFLMSKILMRWLRVGQLKCAQAFNVWKLGLESTRRALYVEDISASWRHKMEALENQGASEMKRIAQMETQNARDAIQRAVRCMRRTGKSSLAQSFKLWKCDVQDEKRGEELQEWKLDVYQKLQAKMQTMTERGNRQVLRRALLCIMQSGRLTLARAFDVWTTTIRIKEVGERGLLRHVMLYMMRCGQLGLVRLFGIWKMEIQKAKYMVVCDSSMQEMRDALHHTERRLAWHTDELQASHLRYKNSRLRCVVSMVDSGTLRWSWSQWARFVYLERTSADQYESLMQRQELGALCATRTMGGIIKQWSNFVVRRCWSKWAATTLQQKQNELQALAACHAQKQGTLAKRSAALALQSCLGKIAGVCLASLDSLKYAVQTWVGCTLRARAAAKSNRLKSKLLCSTVLNVIGGASNYTGSVRSCFAQWKTAASLSTVSLDQKRILLLRWSVLLLLYPHDVHIIFLPCIQLASIYFHPPSGFPFPLIWPLNLF